MVVDLRKVNALMKPIIALLPKNDDLLQQITALNPVHMTTIDFFKGFWHLLLTKKSKKITSFVSPKTYCHLTLPTGLHSSLAAFIQMTSKVFLRTEHDGTSCFATLMTFFWRPHHFLIT